MSTESKPISPSINEWSLIYNDFKPDLEKSRETLLAVGNGYLGSRGAMEESLAGDVHYPGTYVAGLYNRLISKVGDRDIENEDFVNCPNWSRVRFSIDGGDWAEISADSIISIHRELHLKSGVLNRKMAIKNEKGRITEITSRKTASMANPHLLVLLYQIKAVNYSGKVNVESILDGDIINDGVARYRDLNQQHLVPVTEGHSGHESWISLKTTQSKVEIAQACRSTILINGVPPGIPPSQYTKPGLVGTGFSVMLNKGETLMLEKVVAMHSSNQGNSATALVQARDELKNSGTPEDIIKESALSWEKIWDGMDIRIEGDPKSQMLVRLHLYHLLVTASPHNIDIDAGIPARGLHGEAYRGHIFWDELYILPVFNLFFPEISKSVLKYRHRRLDQARSYAIEYGYEGAMFPWQSGSDGREETQIIHLNPISGKWGDDYSSLQRHISIAVAYNIWYYYNVSEDLVFMTQYGAEMFFEICRFWASMSLLDEKSGKYSIKKVMGPDEFHELHPASPDGGVKDNAYTNIMVAWLFKRAVDFWDIIPAENLTGIKDKIGIDHIEIQSWQKIGSNLFLDISGDGVIAQFDGYFDLAELDWYAYRKKYNNIYRLDRILKAEKKSPDDYKLAKQADLLMTYYNLDATVIKELADGMGYRVGDEALRTNYDYYINRTSHGSTLSRVVHAYLANQMGDYDLGWDLYKEALESDYTDIQGGTTAEGIHAGVMGGTVLMVITSFLGVNLKQNYLLLDPHLPKQWDKVNVSFNFKNCLYRIVCTHKEIEIDVKSGEKDEIVIGLCGKKIVLQANRCIKLEY